MGDISTSCKYRDCQCGGMAGKELVIETPATSDTGDTIALDLADYGIMTFLGIYGVVHTTEGSVVVAEAPTTSVSTTTLTITVGGSSASNYKRVYVVWGK